MPPFVAGLRFNDATIDELAGHGLRVQDADDVLAERPKFFLDRESKSRRRQGLQPRWKMIGPDAGGALLTVILEAPDKDRIAHIVTGWPSARGEQTRYHQPGGRRNRP